MLIIICCNSMQLLLLRSTKGRVSLRCPPLLYLLLLATHFLTGPCPARFVAHQMVWDSFPNPEVHCCPSSSGPTSEWHSQGLAIKIWSTFVLVMMELMMARMSEAIGDAKVKAAPQLRSPLPPTPPSFCKVIQNTPMKVNAPTVQQCLTFAFSYIWKSNANLDEINIT